MPNCILKPTAWGAQPRARLLFAGIWARRRAKKIATARRSGRWAGARSKRAWPRRLDTSSAEGYVLLVLRHSPEMGPPPLRYRRAPSPVHFPIEAEVPESLRHLKLRTLLLAILRARVRPPTQHRLRSVRVLECRKRKAMSGARCLRPSRYAPIVVRFLENVGKGRAGACGRDCERVRSFGANLGGEACSIPRGGH